MRVFALLLTFSTVACGDLREARRDENATPKPGTWGHLRQGQSDWLAALPNDARVNVCGDEAAVASSAIDAWRLAGDRRDLVVATACETPEFGKRIMVYDASDEWVAQMCKTVGDVGGFADVRAAAIFLCDLEIRRPVALHEIGHLWGMCDVYPLGDVDTPKADNCDPAWFTGRSRRSVMGANFGESLTPADIAGARALARRADLRAARE